MTQLQREIVEKLNMGMKNAEIARVLGCTPTTVSYVKTGKRGKNSYLTAAKAEMLRDLWFAGNHGAVEIAKMIKLPVEKVIGNICRLERKLAEKEASKCQA